MNEVRIGTRTVGEGTAVIIVAEIANAHEGDLARAKALVRAAGAAEADAVKVQMIRADGLLTRNHPRYDHFRKLEFTLDEWKEIFREALLQGLPVLADLFDEESVDWLMELGVAGFKIHASDTCNSPLIAKISRTGIPILLSAGGATEEEIAQAVEDIRSGGDSPVILLHGYQGYPTDPREMQLLRIRTLKERFSLPVGIQDHQDGGTPMAPLVPLIALGMGISVVEKHLTLDRDCRGIDFYSSLEPEGFWNMVRRIREAERMLGIPEIVLTPRERIYREQVRKKVVSRKSLDRETILSTQVTTAKRAEDGLSMDWLNKICGRKLRRSVPEDAAIRPEWVEWNAVVLIAVRMHSTRLPGKAMIPIGGQEAIGHLIDRLKMAKIPKRIVLCTSTHPDDRILETVALRKGIGFFAGSEDDVMGRFLAAARKEEAEIIVRVTGDDILVDPGYLDRLILHHIQEGADYSAAPGLPKGTECEVISAAALERAHQWAEDPSFSEYMTFYLKNPSFFKISEMSVEERHRRPQYRLTLDYAEDLSVIREVFKKIHAEGKIFSLDELISFLDLNQEIQSWNARVPSKKLPDNLNTQLKRECSHVG